MANIQPAIISSVADNLLSVWLTFSFIARKSKTTNAEIKE
ncbi:hypothetical protein AXX16_0737 [Serratia rubidaea]|nr:hypothetical protein AXX16_0737 [Serratia rubidaea]